MSSGYWRLEPGNDGWLLVHDDGESFDMSDTDGLIAVRDTLNAMVRSMKDRATAYTIEVAQVAGVKQLIRDMDMQATKLGDGDDVTGYQFNTGAWHRLLGWCSGAALPAYIRQQREPLNKRRCPACNMLSIGDTCQMCGGPTR